jgi:hypothetical protein
LSFQFRPKQTPPAVAPPDDYAELLHQLRHTPVVFYDMATRRAWLLDGERAVLHILHHRILAMGPDFADPPVEIQIAEARDLASARSAMARNGRVKLRDGWSAAQGTSTEVYFSRAVKETFEVLTRLAGLAVSEYKRLSPLADVGLHHRVLIAFEYRALVTISPGQIHRPIGIKLDASAGNWPALVHEVGAVALAASNFQELLKPADEVSMCTAMKTLPSFKDLLASEWSTVMMLDRSPSTENVNLKRLTTTNLGCAVSADVFKACNKDACDCERIIEIKRIGSAPTEVLAPD